MRVIGIDPGIEKTGFAILETARGKFSVLDLGCIMTSSKSPFSNRLVSLASDLKRILRQWKPASAGIEELFFSKNIKTAMKVSHARGVIMETLEDQGIPIIEFKPQHIKIAVTGCGRADKYQVKKMIQCLLGLNLKNDDTADAVACAICLLSTKYR